MALERKTVPWRALDGLWIQLLAIVGGGLVTIPLVRAIDIDLATAISTLVTEVLLGALVLVWVRKRGGTLRDLGLRGNGRDVGVGIGIGALGVVVASLVAGLILFTVEAIKGGPVSAPEQIQIEDASPSIGLWALLALGIVIVAPIAEELLFRGFVFRAMRNWARPTPAILLSAAFFAVVHVLPLVLVPIFVLGVMLAGLTERRGSIIAPIAAHMTFNAWGFVLLVLQKT